MSKFAINKLYWLSRSHFLENHAGSEMEIPKRGPNESHKIRSGDVSALLSASEGSESDSETESDPEADSLKSVLRATRVSLVIERIRLYD